MAHRPDGDDYTDEVYGDRKRGFLTKSDREYLAGKDIKDDNLRYKTKTRLRKRIRNAVLDFSILYSSRGLPLLEDAFENVLPANGDEWRPEHDTPLMVSLMHLFGAIFYALKTSNDDSDPFDILLERGIADVYRQRARNDSGDYADARPMFQFFEHDRYDTEEVLERFEEGSIIHVAPLNHLVRTGEISPGDRDRYLRDLDSRKSELIEVVEANPIIPTMVHPEELERTLDIQSEL